MRVLQAVENLIHRLFPHPGVFHFPSLIVEVHEHVPRAIPYREGLTQIPIVHVNQMSQNLDYGPSTGAGPLSQHGRRKTLGLT